MPHLHQRSFITGTVFSDPVGAKLCAFSDAQARGYNVVVLIFIGISGPERSDERVEQGQAGRHGGRGAAAVVARDHRLRPQQTSSSRPLPQGQGRLR